MAVARRATSIKAQDQSVLRAPVREFDEQQSRARKSVVEIDGLVLALERRTFTGISRTYLPLSGLVQRPTRRPMLSMPGGVAIFGVVTFACMAFVIFDNDTPIWQTFLLAGGTTAAAIALWPRRATLFRERVYRKGFRLILFHRHGCNASLDAVVDAVPGVNTSSVWTAPSPSTRQQDRANHIIFEHDWRCAFPFRTWLLHLEHWFHALCAAYFLMIILKFFDVYTEKFMWAMLPPLLLVHALYLVHEYLKVRDFAPLQRIIMRAYKSARLDEAEWLLHAFLESHHDDANAWKLLAEVRVRRHDFDGALACCAPELLGDVKAAEELAAAVEQVRRMYA